ncbi:LacI family DNA-binding transcriptional regulator [Bacillus kwashiorkori]|uniref:LacI family DNA-binding transcriptional regulator n=1 Tax=Bacillus kwashiorkori TaxID=1522318 RepID=UPI0007862534|nr:LacI family DNA-binding transcriptional regulator [Bacillus kwashiorkori]
MPYTIKDVAKLANVSTATVSRVLNDQGGYSEKTKQKVLAVIQDLGYEPNAIARGLVNRRTHTIGFLAPDLTSTFANELLKGVEKAVHDRGSSVIVCHTENHGVKTMKYLQLLHEKRIDGIIYTSHELKEEYYEYIKKMNVPLVLLATETEQYSVPFVKVNDRAAAFSATEYLIKNGHRKIGLIIGEKSDRIATIPRLEGYRTALAHYQIDFNWDYVIFSDSYFFRDGIAGLRNLREVAPEVTAVFAGSDEIAMGVLSECYRKNIKVPDRLSVIGYDNIKIAEMTTPALTTIAQPLTAMGERSAQMIFTMLNGERLVSSQFLPHTIIERESVKNLN